MQFVYTVPTRASMPACFALTSFVMIFEFLHACEHDAFLAPTHRRVDTCQHDAFLALIRLRAHTCRECDAAIEDVDEAEKNLIMIGAYACTRVRDTKYDIMQRM
jgi:hypothetical protein